MWQAALAVLGTFITAYFLWLGARYTASKSAEGQKATTEVAAADSALKAWQGLLEPYIAEVARVRTELTAEREERAVKDRRDEEDRADAKRLVTQQMEALQDQVDKLRDEVKVWKRVAQTIARWATTLRDEVLRLGGTVPATPDELLTLQAIQEHEQS
jgi:hypothetical protein